MPARCAPARTAAPPRPLRVVTLGRFGLYRDGADVGPRVWGRRKSRELLWLLCARESHAIGRQEATELLWPDDRLEPGNVRLRVVLHALRSACDPDRTGRVVRTVGERLVLDGSVVVDADQFRGLARRARSAADPRRAFALDRAALALYHGPFLADAPYLDWAEPTRHELRNLLVEVCLRTGFGELARGRPAAAADLARRVLDADPYREAAFRMLARAHRCAGDPAEARRVYEHCRARLRADLGVEPSWALDRP